MARFPRSEADLIALAQLMVQGMIEAGAGFGTPPVSVEELRASLDEFNRDWAAAVEGDAIKRERHARKDASQKKLADSLRAIIRHAEIVFRREPEQLSRFGWGPRRVGGGLEIPGEVRDMSIVEEGEGWITLRWKAPVNGGEPAVYQVQRKRGVEPWENVAIATGTEERLSAQPRGVELSYRVAAANKAGVGRASVTVTAVL